MASSLVLRKLAAAPNLQPKTLMLIRPAALSRSASRILNTSAAFEADSDEPDSDSDSRSSRLRDFYADPWHPFTPETFSGRKRQMMQNNPFLMALRILDSDTPLNNSRGFNVNETGDSLIFQIDMPGLGKEDVKIKVEHDVVIIKGEEAKECEDEEGRKYTKILDLPEKEFKRKEMKAEMKNGVLKLVVPKLNQEERSGEFQVKVE